jgi:hypothetical protein
MHIFKLKGNNLKFYEVYLVSSYHTDKYIFEAESKYSIKEYLVNECHIFKNNNMSINEIFSYLKNNKRSYSFTFASGRYYYLKDIRLVEKIKLIEDFLLVEDILVQAKSYCDPTSYIKNLCIIS